MICGIHYFITKLKTKIVSIPWSSFNVFFVKDLANIFIDYIPLLAYQDDIIEKRQSSEVPSEHFGHRILVKFAQLK